jgi:hypothetical protein
MGATRAPGEVDSKGREVEAVVAHRSFLHTGIGSLEHTFFVRQLLSHSRREPLRATLHPWKQLPG